VERFKADADLRSNLTSASEHTSLTDEKRRGRSVDNLSKRYDLKCTGNIAYNGLKLWLGKV
jgi:hypothetical protein